MVDYLAEDTANPVDNAPIHLWYGTIAEDVPDFYTNAYVLLPDLAPDHRFGPCFWPRRDETQLPTRGDRCIAMFDNRGQVWILGWWPDTPWPFLVPSDGIVRLNQNFYVQGYIGAYPTGYGALAFVTAVIPGDVVNRLVIDNTGNLAWSSGTATADTWLYREAAGVLASQALLHILPNFWLSTNNGNTGPQIEFAWGGSTRQYRHTIQSSHDGGNTSNNSIDFYVWTTADAVGALPTVRVLRLAGDQKLWIGNAQDTNLYRASPNVLRTDGSFVMAGNLYCTKVVGDPQGQIELLRDYAGVGLPGLLFGPGGTNPPDIALYRQAANTLRTDNVFTVGGRTGITPNGAGGDIIFQGDTNLYRSAAGVVKTDGAINAAGGHQVGANTVINSSGVVADTALPGRLGTVGTRVPGNDFNQATSEGWYYSFPGDANTPGGSYYGILVTNVTATSHVRQIAYDYQTDLIFMRRCTSGTWGAWAQTWPLATSIPATTLPTPSFDGQTAILVDSTTAPTYSWQLQWSSASGRWLNVGGSALEFDSTTTYSFTTTAYVVLGTGLTVPRTGVYQIDYGSSVYIAAAGIQPIWLTPKLGAAAAADGDGVRNFLAGGVINMVEQMSRSVKRSLNASDVVQLACRLNAGGATAVIENPWLKITPVTLT